MFNTKANKITSWLSHSNQCTNELGTKEIINLRTKVLKIWNMEKEIMEACSFSWINLNTILSDKWIMITQSTQTAMQTKTNAIQSICIGVASLTSLNRCH